MTEHSVSTESERIVSTENERIELPLEDDFTIARGTTSTTENVLVRLTDESGRVGLGSAAPSEYYGETPDSVEAALPELLDAVEAIGDPHNQQAIEDELMARAPGEAAARAAVSVAVHDLAATQRAEPLYRRWGLDADRVPGTSYTIAIADPAEMAERTRNARDAGYPILKVKLGTDDDRSRLRAIREAAPEARIRVDANCAWTPEETLDNSEWLADVGVEFLEQPVPADDIDGLARIQEQAPFPIAADESCVTATDVPHVADAVDIVVVKLMKCGGLRPAARQIATAHAHGLDVMLGCMVESVASIAGAWQIAPLVEYADLDGSLLLAADPCEGPDLSGGTIDLTTIEDGTGVRERE